MFRAVPARAIGSFLQLSLAGIIYCNSMLLYNLFSSTNIVQSVPWRLWFCSDSYTHENFWTTARKMYLSQQKNELSDHYYNITKHISFAYSLGYPNMGHPEIKLLRDRDVLWYALNLSQTNRGTTCAALSNFHILMQRAKSSCLMPGKLKQPASGDH